MAYAQKNYPQQLGNGNFTIAEAGCFLTAMANLIEKNNGSGPDPVTLNQFFLNNNSYIRDSDGALEDLAWSTITVADNTITVAQVGNGALPSSDNAIVKFHYNSVHTGNPIDHFCMVDHVDGNQVYILDSWDGQVKGPNGYAGVYHMPVSWATYQKTAAPEPAYTPPAPAASLPAAPMQAPSTEVYDIVKPIAGYMSGTAAGNHTDPVATLDPNAEWHIFRTYPGRDDLKNVTQVLGQPGYWINEADNVPEPEVPKDYVEITVEPNWGVTSVLAAAGYPEASQGNEAEWDRLAALNDSPTRLHFQAGQVVKVNKEPLPIAAPVEPEMPKTNSPDWIPPRTESDPTPEPPNLAYQDTFTRNEGGLTIKYEAIADYLVKDIAGVMPDKWLYHGQDVLSYGTFSDKGTLYARVSTQSWRGVPLAVNGELQKIIVLQTDVYDTSTDTATRRVMKTLKPRDYIVLFISNLEKFVELIRNLPKKTKK